MKIRKLTHGGVTGMLSAVLLAAAAFTFPYASDFTWSLPSSEAEHTLTYTTGSLTWDSSADIDENGAMRLSMFSSEYENVRSHDGRNVVAPGTSKNTSIRLMNGSSGEISYTAVLYRTDSTEVPVISSLSGGDTVESYSLPQGVTVDMVVNAVGGTVDGGDVEALDVSWAWHFYEDEPTDRHDTMLGIQAPADEVKYGLYIVVSDSNAGNKTDVNPDDTPDDKKGDIVTPKTGDSSDMTLWLVLAAISLCALIFFVLPGGRSEKEQKKDEE